MGMTTTGALGMTQGDQPRAAARAHDVPAGWLAVGTPARPVRRIAADSVTCPSSAVLGRLSSEQRPAGAGSD